MRKGSRYSLSALPGVGGTARLVRDDVVTSTEVEGVLLEEQFLLADGNAVLWLTEDSPHDEGLHIYLVDAQASIVDAMAAGAAFTAGVLEIKSFGDEWCEFEFFRNHVLYRLIVDREPVFRLPLPTGWRYKRAFRKHRLSLQKSGDKGNAGG